MTQVGEPRRGTPRVDIFSTLMCRHVLIQHDWVSQVDEVPAKTLQRSS